MEGQKYSLRTLERGLSILKLFSLTNQEELSILEISQKTGLAQSTTFRLLVTLKLSGFVEQDKSSGKYRLGSISLALGDAYLRNNDLRRRAYPVLVNLRDQSSETVHLAVLGELDVVYLDKLAGLHPIGLMSSRIGGRAEAYCTGLGKSLLAYLSENYIYESYQNSQLTKFTENTITNIDDLLLELGRVRNQGFAVDNEEHEIGVGCIACPVFDNKGVIAAISVSGPVERVLDRNIKKELILLIKKAANEISTSMGGSNFTTSDEFLFSNH